MAPISSGSSTWTSAGLPFSFVSMATGMGPPSSGGQATVASVVTSTLLAGLGFSGSIISSLPGSFWPTHSTNTGPSPTQNPATPTAKNSPSEDSTDAQKKPEEEEQKKEDDEETEEEEEEEEQRDEEKKKKKKGKDVMVKDKKQAAQNSTAPIPTSKHRDRERADAESSTLNPAGVEEQLSGATERPDVEDLSKPMWQEENDMQIPSSSTESSNLSNEEKANWPYYIHTGMELL